MQPITEELVSRDHGGTQEPIVFIIEKNPYHSEVGVALAHLVHVAYPGARIAAYCPSHLVDFWPLFQKTYPGRVELLRAMPDLVPPGALLLFSTGRDAPAVLTTHPVVGLPHQGHKQQQHCCLVLHTLDEALAADAWQGRSANASLLALSPLVHRRHILPVVPWPTLCKAYDPSPLVVVVGMSDYSRGARDSVDFERLVLSDRVDVALITREAEPKWQRFHRRLRVHESLDAERMVALSA